MSMMCRMPVLALFATTVLASAAAYAQDNRLRGDANGDERLDRPEFVLASTTRLARFDADGNGTIDRAEMEAAAQRAADRARARLARLFERTDGDTDGTVTRAEMEAAAGARFARLDRDGDGLLRIEELRRRKPAGAPQSSIGTPN